jgi:hypothetical protein
MNQTGLVVVLAIAGVASLLVGRSMKARLQRDGNYTGSQRLVVINLYLGFAYGVIGALILLWKQLRAAS